MRFRIETEQEVDGRWIAEISNMPGVMVYGQTVEEAIWQVVALALRVLADQIEQERNIALASNISFVTV